MFNAYDLKSDSRDVLNNLYEKLSNTKKDINDMISNSGYYPDNSFYTLRSQREFLNSVLTWIESQS